MGINSVYVVFKGRKTGMCYSWPECQAQVDGFPGATYQKFKSTDEAYKAITAYVHSQNSIESFEENVSEKVQSTEKVPSTGYMLFLFIVVFFIGAIFGKLV
jgi:viroplasmin and RNaseH domain-containing protein